MKLNSKKILSVTILSLAAIFSSCSIKANTFAETQTTVAETQTTGKEQNPNLKSQLECIENEFKSCCENDNIELKDVKDIQNRSKNIFEQLGEIYKEKFKTDFSFSMPINKYGKISNQELRFILNMIELNIEASKKILEMIETHKN